MKIARKGYAPAGRLCSRFRSNLSKNFNFWVLHPYRCTDGVKFGTKEGTFGPLLHAKFHPHRCNVSPLQGEKPQNRPLSKLNTGRFALRTMLPVITDYSSKSPSNLTGWTNNKGYRPLVWGRSWRWNGDNYYYISIDLLRCSSDPLNLKAMYKNNV